MFRFAKYNPFYKIVAEAQMKWISNEYLFEGLIAATETVPLKVMDFWSRLPYVGSSKARKQVAFANKMSKKMYDTQSLFHHFINNSWTFESRQNDNLISLMSEQEKIDFNFNMRTLCWTKSY
jgi:hypothetical protein